MKSSTDYNDLVRRVYLSGLTEKKKKIATLPLEQKMKILNELRNEGQISFNDSVYFILLHNLEDYSDLTTIA